MCMLEKVFTDSFHVIFLSTHDIRTSNDTGMHQILKDNT